MGSTSALHSPTRRVTSPVAVGSGLAATRDPLGQIKTRDRVRDLAEVFTHEREVGAMLDLIPDTFTDTDTKFLEPACGSGNFLVEILARKLALVSSRTYRVQTFYEHRLLRCAASIYGIDISLDNAEEARDRMAHVAYEHYSLDANTWVPTDGFATALAEILETNIVWGDTLKEAAAITFIEYTPAPGQAFIRTESPLIEPEHDLFHAPAASLPPAHYSELADTRP